MVGLSPCWTRSYSPLQEAAHSVNISVCFCQRSSAMKILCPFSHNSVYVILLRTVWPHRGRAGSAGDFLRAVQNLRHTPRSPSCSWPRQPQEKPGWCLSAARKRENHLPEQRSHAHPHRSQGTCPAPARSRSFSTCTCRLKGQNQQEGRTL